MTNSSTCQHPISNLFSLACPPTPSSEKIVGRSVCATRSEFRICSMWEVLMRREASSKESKISFQARRKDDWSRNK
jgi:hypothetical protein